MPEPPDDRGDRERRFRLLYQENYGAIRAYAVRRSSSAEDVSDVVADTFLAAWRRLGDVPPPPDDRLWLYGVARRVMAGQHRSLRRRSSLLTRLAATQAGAGQEPTAPAADRVTDALARLRPGEREALQLVVWESLSHAEAAAVLGCSPNAVAIRVHRAKARLRNALAPKGQAEPTRLTADSPMRQR